MNADKLNYFNYFTEIEDTFVRRRGKHLFLSPLDWAMMETWQERGIPLHVVIRAVESVFDARERQPQPSRTVKTLFYCREEVEMQFAEWSSSQVGSGSAQSAHADEFDSDSIREHIEQALERLRAVQQDELRDAIDRAITRLDEMTDSLVSEPETLDSSFADIEKVLDAALVENWDKTDIARIRKELERELREYKNEMTPESYANTFDLMLKKRLRETAGIPRLGLFYI